jgi:hypothetical protein
MPQPGNMARGKHSVRRDGKLCAVRRRGENVGKNIEKTGKREEIRAG